MDSEGFLSDLADLVEQLHERCLTEPRTLLWEAYACLESAYDAVAEQLGYTPWPDRERRPLN